MHTTLYNSCALPNKCFVTLLKSVPFKASKFNNVMQNVHVLFMIMLMLINCQFNDPKPHNNCLPQSDNWTETLKKTPRLTPLYRCVIYNAMHVAFTIKVHAVGQSATILSFLLDPQTIVKFRISIVLLLRNTWYLVGCGKCWDLGPVKLRGAYYDITANYCDDYSNVIPTTS